MRAPTWHVIHRGRLGRAAVPAGAALILLAAVAQAQQEPLTATPFTQPDFVEADCSTWFGRTRGAHVDCGYLSVLEDRARPDGNVIRLAVARLRGSVPSPQSDPVIYLAGGPGESALDKAGSVFREQAFIADTRFIWEERDLILLDQRGVGRSEPRLECPDYRRQRAELPVLDLDPDELQREVDALLACKRALSEQGIDLSAYTPEAIAADVADLAAAMGYQTYNLYGSSFGTRLALTVMRDFPDHVRSAVLDGVWPPQVNAAEARHANAAAALEALFRRCEADPECSRLYPDLEQELWQIVDRYTAHPTTIPKHDGHYLLGRVVESLPSNSWIPYLPFLVHRIAVGDHAVADAFIQPLTPWGAWIHNSAAWTALLCHAEGSFADLSRVLADRAAHPRIGDPETADLVPALCAVWHDPTTGTLDRTPLASAVPTLLLSGEFDPTTPSRWADLAAETLSRSHSFVVPMGGHGVGLDTRCGRALVGAFLTAPGADPSPACAPAADQRSGFRTIYLNRLDHVPVSIRWYDYPALKVLMALGVLLIVVLQVSALILWSVAALIRRVGLGAEPAPRRIGHPWLTAAAVIAISAAFSWSVGAAVEVLYAFWALAPSRWMPWPVISFFTAERTWLTDEVVRNFGYYPWVRPLFVIPYLTAAATVYVLYLALRSWREKWGTRLARVHYSIVAITLAWYPFHLVSSGIIP